jgi:hypothetical protein
MAGVVYKIQKDMLIEEQNEDLADYYCEKSLVHVSWC